MSDLADRVRSLGREVEAGYGPERTEQALASLHANLRWRRGNRIALAGLSGVLCLAAGSAWVLRSRPETAMPIPVEPPRSEGTLRLADGTVVTPLDQSSRVVTKRVSQELVELDLVAGGALFDVTPDRSRQFRVNAGPIAVLVLGTRFTVTRQGTASQVEVQRGQVSVEWERGQQLLNPGERGSFPPVERVVSPSLASETEKPHEQPRAVTVPGRLGPD